MPGAAAALLDDPEAYSGCEGTAARSKRGFVAATTAASHLMEYGRTRLEV
jgi:hypothetical protein